MGGFIPLVQLDASLILLHLKLRKLSPRDIWMFSINLLKPSGHYMYHQFNILPTQLYLCVLCGSQNKQRLFPYTALTCWFL